MRTTYPHNANMSTVGHDLRCMAGRIMYKASEMSRAGVKGVGFGLDLKSAVIYAGGEGG